MKRLILALVWAVLLTGAPFFLWNPLKNIWALNTPQFRLQVASLSTEMGARKEIERLKSFKIQAQYIRWLDRSKKTWFVVNIEGYKSEKEAIRYGKQFIREGIIQSFKVFPQKEKEVIPTKATEAFPPASSLPKKEPKSILEEKPVYFGPITIKEEENDLRINISMDRNIFPTITSDKVADGSRLIVTFNNIDRYIVPFEFDKIQSKTLLSFGLAQRGTDCIFNLLLNSAYNYEVTQDYYEKEKIYSLIIKRGPTPEPKQVIKE